MNSTLKIAAGAAAAVGGVMIVAGGWVGASVYGGRVAEDELKAWASQSTKGSSVRISNLRHESGWLRSGGRFDVRIEDDCSPSAAGREIASVQVDYRLDHLVLPGSLMRFEWSLRPGGEAGAAFARAFGPGARLEGQGKVSFGRELVSSLSLPELNLRDGGAVVQMSPTRGRVSLGRTAFGLEWKTDRIVARGGGQALELRGIAIEMDLRNRLRGIGTTSFAVDAIATSAGTAEGLRLATEVSERGDRIDMKIAPTLRGLSVAGQQAKNLALEIAVRDLHAASVETLGRIAGDSCGLQNLTAEEDGQLRVAARTLLASGFSLGVTKLVGSVGDGSLDGRLQLEMRKTEPPGARSVEFARLLRASGELVLKGGAVTTEQSQMAVALGLAATSAEGLKASFDYGDGVLKANGKVFDAGAVQLALAQADRQINAFLDRPAVAAARPSSSLPPEQAATPPAAPPDAPAQAPAAAPAATATPVEVECAVLAACVRESLRAAAREDLEAMRAAASRIDALAKPDPGNRVVSRKLNGEGLESLKRGDTAASVDLFRRARQENPRDVEIVANLGYAMVRAGRATDAVAVLTDALVLDPRRTSTWTPLAEAFALAGRRDDALAALWIGWQWATNREKALAFYADRAEKEREERPALAELYAAMSAWAGGGARPMLASLGGSR